MLRPDAPIRQPSRTRCTRLCRATDKAPVGAGRSAPERLPFLTKPLRRFTRALSELRNDPVHDIRNVNFDLGAHVNTAAGDAKAASALVRTWVLVVEDDPMEYTLQGEAQ